MPVTVWHKSSPFALLTGEGWKNSPSNAQVSGEGGREGGSSHLLRQDRLQLFQQWFCTCRVSAKNWHALRLRCLPAIG